MALDLNAEQREIGKGNFNRVVGKLHDRELPAEGEQGVTRRRFMQGLIAAGATVPVSAAAYFGYSNHRFPNDFRPVKAGLIGAGDEGGVLVGEHNPNFVQFVAYSDIRPSNQKRIFEDESLTKNSPRRGFKYHYGSNAHNTIRLYENYKELLSNPDIEMVVIALPLHLHAPVAIEAMNAGKHVLCEKLMAWNITQCKEMIKTADEKQRLLAIGHQRHYSMLYAHANDVVRSGVLGEIKHIRALWHRNNVKPNTDPRTRAQRPYVDSWWPVILPEDSLHLQNRITQLGYKDMNELVRWRVYNRTGGGLMAELGSHQLDACSIFLGKKHPLSVTAVGGKHFYKDNRDADDHVYCIYEFPGPTYPQDQHDIITVTYSSISTNDFEGYGECIMGSKGTLIVEKEANAMLWGIQGRSTEVTASAAGARPVLDASSSTAPVEQRATSTGQNAIGHNAPSRGYREEMEHFAYCIRSLGTDPSPEQRLQFKPRCDGRAAMADAIVALAANESMRTRTRIVFQDDWFKAEDAAVPDPDRRVVTIS
jgi:predicted dehydrogenase